MSTLSAPKNALSREGMHRDLEQVFGITRWCRIPDCAALNRLWAKQARPAGARHLSFVPQDARLPFPQLSYAQRIARCGLIATRPDNWHDAFNALTWLLFPRTKLALVMRLADDDAAAATGARSPQQDALTLFDECAVVLAVSDSAFRAAHAAHDWQSLFVRQRAAWGVSIRPVVFGHGFYDQARRPYSGLTAKAWYVAVPAAAIAAPPAELAALLDRALAENLTGQLVAARQLLPLPALGVPGWWPANADEAFYDDTDYFRPARG